MHFCLSAGSEDTDMRGESGETPQKRQKTDPDKLDNKVLLCGYIGSVWLYSVCGYSGVCCYTVCVVMQVCVVIHLLCGYTGCGGYAHLALPVFPTGMTSDHTEPFNVPLLMYLQYS